LISKPADERLAHMRHSAAHVLAEAMLELMPEAELGIGRHDTASTMTACRPLTQEDLTWLEERMRASIKRQHLSNGGNYACRSRRALA
jgi:threonyl-tRNA synthetase